MEKYSETESINNEVFISQDYYDKIQQNIKE